MMMASTDRKRFGGRRPGHLRLARENIVDAARGAGHDGSSFLAA
jgi:hypothetical protein